LVRRILLIDDDEDLCSVLQAALQAAGYEVEYEVDGGRALELQRNASFDVVITDIFMPGREGLETIRQLRHEFPNVRIIAMSGGGDLVAPHDYLRVAGHLGAAKTLNKPFGSDVLIATVREVLDQAV
jgi:DNA-binding response OmpR family regulator